MSAKKITRFIKTRRPVMRANYLNVVCSKDQGQCLAFGTEIKRIRDHFKGFTDFALVSDVVKIGAQSNNGFIRELKYEREGFVSYAVLKSTLDRRADNLAYEYYVGVRFINHYSKFFPVFLETYGLFTYANEAGLETMKQHHSGNLPALQSILVPDAAQHVSNTVCTNPELKSILIQHIHRPKSFASIRKMLDNPGFARDHFMPVLFQVYHALSSLADVYTHYDLHCNNILLFDITKRGKPAYATFVYHLENGTTVDFDSIYVAKIIDYGRNYFVSLTPNAPGGSSSAIFGSICDPDEQPCVDDAGDPLECSGNGFWVSGGASTRRVSTAQTGNSSSAAATSTAQTGNSSSAAATSTANSRSNYYINSSVLNRSHDLFALFEWFGYFNFFENEVMRTRMKYHEFFEYKKFLQKYENANYIAEDPNMTVITAFAEIANLVVLNKPQHSSRDKIGTFHIYGKTRPMEFVPEPATPAPAP